jgi:hypothetical protein
MDRNFAMDEMRIIGLAAALNEITPARRQSPTVASRRIERMDAEAGPIVVIYVSALLALLMAVSAGSLLLA